MKKIEVMQGKNLLAFGASAFIIPNPLTKVNTMFDNSYKQRIAEFEKEVCEMNHIGPFSEDDLLVELWFCSEELNSENLVDHGFNVEDADGTRLHLQPIMMKRLPVKLFDGHKEGDRFSVKIPQKTESGEIIMEIALTLDQLGYRYRRFGTFEECLESLKNAM